MMIEVFTLLPSLVNDRIGVAHEVRAGMARWGPDIDELVGIVMQLRGTGFGGADVHTAST